MAGALPASGSADIFQLFTPPNADQEVMKRLEQALVDFGQLGAQIVDPVTRDRRRAPGQDPPGQASLGREAARLHVG